MSAILILQDSIFSFLVQSCFLRFVLSHKRTCQGRPCTTAARAVACNILCTLTKAKSLQDMAVADGTHQQMANSGASTATMKRL